MENKNNAIDEPNADTAIVPFLPNLVSINHEAIYSYGISILVLYNSIFLTTDPGTPANE